MAKVTAWVTGALLSIAGTKHAAAQTRETQLWTAILVTAAAPTPGQDKPSARGLSLWFDLHDRRGEQANTWIVRPGLGYRLSKQTSLWGGYAWIGAYPDSPAQSTVVEHRAWQQVIHQTALGPLTFQLRGRVEQRFREREDVALRLRALGRINATLWPRGPLAVALWDEAFVALGDTSWGSPGGFDQNRLFLGLAYSAGALRLEAGYTAITIRRADDSLLHQRSPTLWAFFNF